MINSHKALGMSTLFWKAFSLLFLCLPISALCFEALRDLPGYPHLCPLPPLELGAANLHLLGGVQLQARLWAPPHSFSPALALSTWEPLASPPTVLSMQDSTFLLSVHSPPDCCSCHLLCQPRDPGLTLSSALWRAVRNTFSTLGARLFLWLSYVCRSLS